MRNETMKKKMLFYVWAVFLSTSLTWQSHAAPIVNNPMTNSLESGRTYYKWIVDINNDGLNDVLIGGKLTDTELKYVDTPSNQIGFGVYIAQPSSGYLWSQYIMSPDGRLDEAIDVDISQCYVGYVSEVSSYGIVTTHSTWNKKTDTTTVQVVCYTVDGDHMKETYLGGVMDPKKPNIYYTKYLLPAHRTTPQLQEFTPQ